LEQAMHARSRQFALLHLVRMLEHADDPPD
jgi:hypothetical protein